MRDSLCIYVSTHTNIHANIHTYINLLKHGLTNHSKAVKFQYDRMKDRS